MALTILAAGILLIGTISASAEAAGEKPSWKAGDFWEYEGTYYFYSLNRRFEVKGEENLVQDGRSYSAFRMAKTDNFSYGPQSGIITYTEWYRSSDLSLLRIEGNLTPMMPPNTTITVTYDPPLPLFQFPLAVGETWTSSSDIALNKTCSNCTINIPPNCNREITSIVDLALTVHVSGQAQSRTFRSYVIKESMWTTGHNLHYYSDEAGFYVKHETFADNGTQVTESHLTSFGYSPPPGPPDMIIIVIVIIVIASAVIVIVIRILLHRRTSSNVIKGGSQRGPPPP